MPDMAMYQVNAKESQSIQVNSPLEIPEGKLDNGNQLCIILMKINLDISEL